MGKISDVAANVSIGYQPEVHTQHICYRLSMIDKSQFILLEGLGERHDLQGPGRLQQAAAVRAQRNEEGGTGGSLMIFVLDISISVMSRHQIPERESWYSNVPARWEVNWSQKFRGGNSDGKT